MIRKQFRTLNSCGKKTVRREGMFVGVFSFQDGLKQRHWNRDDIGIRPISSKKECICFPLGYLKWIEDEMGIVVTHVKKRRGFFVFLTRINNSLWLGRGTFFYISIPDLSYARYDCCLWSFTYLVHFVMCLPYVTNRTREPLLARCSLLYSQ